MTDQVHGVHKQYHRVCFYGGIRIFREFPTDKCSAYMGGGETGLGKKKESNFMILSNNSEILSFR